jgi:hypothetical protein
MSTTVIFTETTTPVVVPDATPTAVILTTGQVGPRGADGPPGTDGDKHFEHVQGVPATVWTITHNLDKYPAVTVVDSSGREVEGDVHHTSTSTLTITFSAAFGGSAYCN